VSAYPGTRALVICAEILTAYASTDNLEEVVGNAIFGDGACGVVISSDPSDQDRCRLKQDHGVTPEVRRVATLRAGEKAGMMGLVFRDGQFRARLDVRIPELVARAWSSGWPSPWG
jgi:predicted naringenin-chalcone synthase